MGQKMKGFFEKLNETCCIDQHTKSRVQFKQDKSSTFSEGFDEKSERSES